MEDNKENKIESLELENQPAEEDPLFSDWPMMQERLKYAPKKRSVLWHVAWMVIFAILTYCAYRFHLYFAILSLIGVGVSVIILIVSLIKTRGIKAKVWPLFLSIYLVCVSIVSVPTTLVTLEDGTQVYEVNIPDGLAKIFKINK
ncbi:MAG: hypothetical protein HFI72_02750 [Peptococcaceae bacterium]|nr:hypothetical protein [Peptococcaceae bacterium]